MDDDVDIVEHEMMGVNPEGMEMFDLATVRTTMDGRIKIENVPPEEFLINREAKSIEDSRFVCHRVRMTLSDLREMYPDETLEIEDISGGRIDADSLRWDAAQQARGSFDGTGPKGSLG